MKRSHVGRLKTAVQCLGTAAILAALVHCGGGTNPPAASEDTPDAGPNKNATDGGGSSAISFPDIDLDKGITFGDNGLTDCGKQAAVKSFTISNSTSDSINYTTALIVGSTYYKVAPEKGGVPAHGSTTVTITPAQIPATSDVTTDLYGGTLELAFPGQGVPIDIKLHQTAHGAIVTMAGSTSAGSNGTAAFDLGSVKVGDKKDLPISLSNAGNQEVTASLSLGSNLFTIDGTQQTSADLQPNQPVSKALSVSPQSATALNDTLTIAYDGSAVHCKPPPTSATITATGTTSVGVSPGTLDFGLVNCGATGTKQFITVTSTIAMSWTPVLGKGAQSPYKLQDENGVAVSGPQQLAAASSFKLYVVPDQIPAVSPIDSTTFADTVTITTTVPGDTTPHVVTLTEGAKGAILKFDQSSVTVSGPVGSNINTNYSLINTGNIQVPYTITAAPSSDATHPGFTTNLTSGNAIIGSTPGVLISKAPTSSGSVTNGTLSVVNTGGVLCADLPPAVPLSVTGTGSAITINPSNLNFGLIDCDGDPAAPQSVTLSSTVSTMIKLSLGGGPNSPYTLASDQANAKPITLNDSVPVAPGAPYVVWLIPKQIKAPASTAPGTTPNGFNDTLTLTSDIPTEAVRTVALTETAHGAIYSFPGQVTASKTQSVPITVLNSGNGTGSFTVSISGAQVSPNSGFLLGAGASTTYSVQAGSGGGSLTIVPDDTKDANGKRLYPICGNTFVATIAPPAQ